MMHIVDVSDTTQDSAGSSKKIQISNLLANIENLAIAYAIALG
jgi:hypothetical protein